jgi:ABC-type uncharacterized transport system ATPase subunit
MATDKPLLKVEGVTKRLPGVVALADATLEASAGEVHGICGENGAGSGSWRADAFRLPFGLRLRSPASSLNHNGGSP